MTDHKLLPNTPQWAMLCEVLVKAKQCPDWVRAAIASPDSSDVSISYTEKVVAIDYIEFLREQIELNVRGREWIELLAGRLQAIEPFVGKILWTYNIFGDQASYVVRVRPEDLLIVHEEAS